MYNVTITFNVNGQIISRNEKDTTLLSDSIDAGDENKEGK